MSVTVQGRIQLCLYKTRRCQCPDFASFNTVIGGDGGCLQVMVLLDFVVTFLFCVFVSEMSISLKVSRALVFESENLH